MEITHCLHKLIVEYDVNVTRSLSRSKARV
jgi:hypothetical protein